MHEKTDSCYNCIRGNQLQNGWQQSFTAPIFFPTFLVAMSSKFALKSSVCSVEWFYDLNTPLKVLLMFSHLRMIWFYCLIWRANWELTLHHTFFQLFSPTLNILIKCVGVFWTKADIYRDAGSLRRHKEPFHLPLMPTMPWALSINPVREGTKQACHNRKYGRPAGRHWTLTTHMGPWEKRLGGQGRSRW